MKEWERVKETTEYANLGFKRLNVCHKRKQQLVSENKTKANSTTTLHTVYNDFVILLNMKFYVFEFICHCFRVRNSKKIGKFKLKEYSEF